MAFKLASGHEEVLKRLVRSRTAAHRQAIRAEALRLPRKRRQHPIVARLGVSPSSAVGWRERLAEERLAKYGEVRKGRGLKPSIPMERVEGTVHATLHDQPPREPHWSCWMMAKAQGVRLATVQWIWSARGLKPHLVETF